MGREGRAVQPSCPRYCSLSTSHSSFSPILAYMLRLYTRSTSTMWGTVKRRWGREGEAPFTLSP